MSNEESKQATGRKGKPRLKRREPRGTFARADAAAAAPKPERYAKFKQNAPSRWQDFSGENKFSIDSDIVAGLKADGLVLEWIPESCLGMPLTDQISRSRRNGWQPVLPGDIDGIHMTEYGGVQLYARPLGLQRQAEEHERRKAQTVIRHREHALKGEGLPVSGGSHESALRSNRINRTMERIEIPRDRG